MIGAWPFWTHPVASSTTCSHEHNAVVYLSAVHLLSETSHLARREHFHALSRTRLQCTPLRLLLRKPAWLPLPDELKRVAAICAPCTLALPTPVQPTSTSNPHSSAPLHPLHPYTLKPFHPETLHLCTLAFLRPRALAPSRPGAFRPTLVTQIQILSTTVRRASFSSPVRTVRGLPLL